MKINNAALSGHLEQTVKPLYLLFGGEPLLVEESADLLRAVFRSKGFEERVRFSVTDARSFDWSALGHATSARSLFSSKRLIELRLPGGRPGDAGAKALAEFSSNPPAETVLVVISGALDRRIMNTKWFKQVESTGVVVEHREVKPSELPGWIAARLRQKGVSFDQEVPPRLAFFVEGNLLAAAQEIDKLSLLFPDQKLTLVMVEETISDSARFTTWGLVDACVAGNRARAFRILYGLKRGGSAPVMVLWPIAQEVRRLTRIAEGLSQGVKKNDLFRNEGIWSARQGVINRALQRGSREDWSAVLHTVAVADRVLKGRQSGTLGADLWLELERVVEQMTADKRRNKAMA